MVDMRWNDKPEAGKQASTHKERDKPVLVTQIRNRNSGVSCEIRGSSDVVHQHDKAHYSQWRGSRTLSEKLPASRQEEIASKHESQLRRGSRSKLDCCRTFAFSWLSDFDGPDEHEKTPKKGEESLEFISTGPTIYGEHTDDFGI